MTLAIVLIGSSFLTSIILVPILIKLAHRYRLLDIPNDRSSHQLPVPNNGGMGIVLIFLFSISLWYFFQGGPRPLFESLLTGGILVAGIGLLDDYRPINIRFRLIFHFIAAGLVLLFFGGMPALDLGFMTWKWQALGTIVGWLGLVWLINFYNFMDGIDGLAVSEAIFVSLAIAFLLGLKGTYSLIPIFLCLAAVTSGFIFWNWAPARIFMGDSGSGFLGFVFGALLVMTVANSALTPWQWLIILGCFWVDATITLIWRLVNGEVWHQAHCSHAFQQIAIKTHSHKHVVKKVMAINIFWLLPNAVWSLYYPNYVILITLLAITPLVILCVVLKVDHRSDSRYRLVDTVIE